MDELEKEKEEGLDWEYLWEVPERKQEVGDTYQTPGFGETVNLDHIKRHYYGSHRQINPTGIVPLGPALDFSTPHDRGRFAR